MQLHQRLLITARAQWTLRPPDPGDKNNSRSTWQQISSATSTLMQGSKNIPSKAYPVGKQLSRFAFTGPLLSCSGGVAIPYTCRPEPTNFSLITLLLVINHALSGWVKKSSKCWWGQCLLVVRAILHPLKVSCRAQRHFGFLIDTQRILGSLWYRTAMENKRHW